MKKDDKFLDSLMLVYPAKISQEGDGYLATFRDLPNIFSEGETYQEVLMNAQQVLDILLLDMTQDELSIADPSACRKGEVPVPVSPEVAAPVLLQKLRLQRHFSLKKVAHSMGVTYQNYQQIEAGKNITLKSLKRAAAAMGATVEIRLHFAA